MSNEVVAVDSLWGRQGLGVAEDGMKKDNTDIRWSDCIIYGLSAWDAWVTSLAYYHAETR